MRETRDPLQDANALLQIAQDIIGAAEQPSLFDLLVRRALSLLGGDRGFLVLYHGEELRFEVIRNWQLEDYEGGREPLSRSILHKVSEQEELLHIEDASTHPDFAKKESVRELSIRSILAAPIRYQEKKLGILYLESRSPHRFFRDEERQLFLRFIKLTAQALAASLQKLLLTQRISLLERDYLSRYQLPGVITQDAHFAKLLESIGRASSTNLPILLQGASGTGKELLARCIHLNSARSRQPFLIAQSTATSPEALERELFGYTKGAFVGATQQREGRLVAAHQGTLFLDEVSELTKELQTKLLRVVQYGEVLPLGASKARLVDVRVIAATKRDLAQEVEDGSFREELFYQINAITFQLPRLRDRPADILPLFYAFLKKCCEREPRPVPKVTAGVERLLEAYSWPGNIRELENEVRRLLALTSPDEILLAERLSTRIISSPPSSGKLLRLEEQERLALIQHLSAAEGNRSLAAETLGISREGLRKMLKRHGLEGHRHQPT